ncbi:hypothetical protein V8D89_001296 [Ganoderma adspersum]
MEKAFNPNVDVERSTPLPLRIPTEVCENIIDMLYSFDARETLTNVGTLHSCALVCWAWRLSDNTSFRRLSIILDDGPHLRDYVYQVELTGYHLHNTTSIFSLFPVVFAGKLPNLKRIDVVHFSETDETGFSKTTVSPKAKSTPYIPLHPHFSAILRSFTAVSILYLEETTFRSFSEFLRMIRALTNLHELSCVSVRWITTGSSHPGADFMQQGDWTAGRHAFPPFVPKLRELTLDDIALYGAERLVSMYGSRLTYLYLAVPLSEGLEELNGGGINLDSCTALDKLVLFLTPHFSMDTHAGFVKDLLFSWKPRHTEPYLELCLSGASIFTRQAFADALRDLGRITEAWLQTVEEPHPTGESGNETRIKYKLRVHLYDWKAEEEGWEDHLKSCFPTWEQLQRLSWSFETPQDKHDEWAKEEESPKSDTSIPSSRVEEVDSRSTSQTKVMSVP